MQPCPPRRPTAVPVIATGWARAGSRALHPAARPVAPPNAADVAALDEGWLWAVASGLASVATPWELAEDEVGEPLAELVLATPLYEAWLQAWPAGTRSDEHLHDEPAAFCVVDGALEEWVPADGGLVLLARHGAGEGRVVPAGQRHVLVNGSAHVATALHVTLPAA